MIRFNHLFISRKPSAVNDENFSFLSHISFSLHIQSKHQDIPLQTSKHIRSPNFSSEFLSRMTYRIQTPNAYISSNQQFEISTTSYINHFNVNPGNLIICYEFIIQLIYNKKTIHLITIHLLNWLTKKQIFFYIHSFHPHRFDSTSIFASLLCVLNGHLYI